MLIQNAWPKVLQEADFGGSSVMMEKWLESESPSKVALITDCSIADNFASSFQQLSSSNPATYCPTCSVSRCQASIIACGASAHTVEAPERGAAGARRTLDRMLSAASRISRGCQEGSRSCSNRRRRCRCSSDRAFTGRWRWYDLLRAVA